MIPCERLERWLDAGRPADGSGAHLAHAASCERCAAALADDARVEALLRAEPEDRAPAQLAGAVMRQIRVTPQLAPAPTPPLASRRALAWWSLGGLAMGAGAWAASAYLDSPGPLSTLSAAGTWLGDPGLTVLAAVGSTFAAAGLTWASLKLAHAVEAAAMRPARAR